MVKSAVIYERITKVSSKRTKLVNKRVFNAIDNFKEEFYNFLCSTYDIDQINTINVIGDGASWIKGVGDDLRSPDYKVKQYLDLFHFTCDLQVRKALHHVTKDDRIKEVCEEYIKCSIKKNTTELFEALEITTEIGLKSKEYILNNFRRIKATLKHEIKCSMEGHISHNLASLYASRPRGYSKITLSKLIKLREAHINGVNIVNEIMKQRTRNKNLTNIDYSIFDNLYKDTYSLPQSLKMIS